MLNLEQEIATIIQRTYGNRFRYAHIYRVGRGYELFITERCGDLNNATTRINISNKKFARKLAKQYGAQPWNF